MFRIFFTLLYDITVLQILLDEAMLNPKTYGMPTCGHLVEVIV